MTEIDRTFGEQRDDLEYIDRPGSYALTIRNGEVLCVEEGRGLFLPGGGHEGAETPVEALHRELLEETGFAVAVDAKLAVAEEFFPDRPGIGLRKICHLYRVTLGERRRPSEATEVPVVWLAPEVAEEHLYGEAFEWVVANRLRED